MFSRIRPCNKFAALLLTFCYLWLSTVASVQHVHAPANRRAVCSTTEQKSCMHVSRTASAATALQAVSEQEDRCPICDWQTAGVSMPVLPFAFFVPFSSALDVDTAAPRSPSRTVVYASSRAPPFLA